MSRFFLSLASLIFGIPGLDLAPFTSALPLSSHALAPSFPSSLAPSVLAPSAQAISSSDLAPVSPFDLAPSPVVPFPFALDFSAQGPSSAALAPSSFSALAPSAPALSSSHLAPSAITPPPGAGRSAGCSWVSGGAGQN